MNTFALSKNEVLGLGGRRRRREGGARRRVRLGRVRADLVGVHFLGRRTVRGGDRRRRTRRRVLQTAGAGERSAGFQRAGTSAR